MSDTIPVEYRVLDIEPVRGAGRLVAVAAVEIDLAGIVVELHGCQVIREPDGLVCRAPQWRHPATGAWTAGIVLPDALMAAIGREVLEALRPPPAVLRPPARPPGGSSLPGRNTGGKGAGRT